MIQLGAQDSFADQISASLSLNASHASHVSHPNEIADFYN
jgi:hypothetical protein